MSADQRPLIAVTMGDPAGVGPEITAKALANPKIRAACRLAVVGDLRTMERAAGAVGVNVAAVDVDALDRGIDGIQVYDPWGRDLNDVPVGTVDARAGAAAAEAVIVATKLALDGRVAAIVTAPLNKAAINAAGYNYAGHTELLADLTDSPGARMLLVAPGLRVIHNSTHVSLREAIARVTRENVRHVIGLLDETLRRMAIREPRIAVCGLNPHAGEGGLFGDEDDAFIRPAIEDARKDGIDATGPEPGDTVFNRARDGAFDGVVAMYHDQGHVAVKVAGFFDGINVSVGLPIIRTSVDHGTAFDIAGQGIARADSMEMAIEIAATMAVSDGRPAAPETA
ncbi:MAG: 4-hydroxythreonine-4-phosphate dehydrogenase PdxA [Chloroflexi bacterium]|nr:4-hydroxythreonine-4-phosphate dehydrogenase PdxA [Chloroflexota bacterium]MCY3959202.1 4-hydroxythreonine-4-phosphate dehydrogenase PdxA [Chloroflexota bacterium]